MTMKKLYGLLGGRRNQFSPGHQRIIVELAMMVKPTFVVLDGTTSMMPTAPLRLAGRPQGDQHHDRGTDPIAADACGRRCSQVVSRSAVHRPRRRSRVGHSGFRVP